MKKLSKKQATKIIEDIAGDYVKGYNSCNGDGKTDIDSLFNFGSMGLHTPKEIAEMYYYEVEKRIIKELKKCPQ